MILTCIAAIAENGAIGKDQKLPWHLSEDLKRFKKLTMDHPIIMGRKTFESIGKPLPNRTSIIGTQNVEFKVCGAVVAHSIRDAIHYAHDIEQTVQGIPETFVIGGETIFRAMLPLSNRLYLTHIQATVDGNVFFPKLDMSKWHSIHEESHPADQKNNYAARFAIYERTKSIRE